MANYLEGREEYFEDWLLELSEENEIDRTKVTNDDTAKDFIKDTFNKDTSLRNLIDGMEQTGQSFNPLIKGDFIQKLIAENTGEEPPKVSVVSVPREKVTITEKRKIRNLADAQNRALRKEIFSRVYTPQVQKSLSIRADVTRKGTTRYRDINSGKFVSNKRLIRGTQSILLADNSRREEIERLLRRDLTEDHYV